MLRAKTCKSCETCLTFFCSFRASFEITTSRETHILIFCPSFLSEKSRRQRVASVSPARRRRLQTVQTRRHITEQEPSSRSLRDKYDSHVSHEVDWSKRDKGYRKAFPRAILGYEMAFRVHQMQQRRYLDPTI